MEERLQKIIARAGIASRREAEKLIQEGRVSVNGKTITILGTKANSEKDEIRVNGARIFAELPKIYLILNKPKGYITALNDSLKRPVVVDLLDDIAERVFPVGRLDFDSEGMLLLTNDGDFAYRVQHPTFGISKTYRVKVTGNISKRDVEILSKGVKPEDGFFKPLQLFVEKNNKKSCWARIVIAEGRNRVIRRFFEAGDRSVTRLIRISIAGIELGNLKSGEYRYLQKREIKQILNTSSMAKQEN